MNRRGKIRVGTFALAAALVLGASFALQAMEKSQAETTLSYVYQRAVNDLSGYVSGMEAALEKARYANTATAQTSLAAQLLEESSGAKAALAALPTSGENSNNINRFLSQAGDYASYLSRRLAAGSTLGEEEFNNLSSLRQYAQTLNQELQKLEERFRYGRVTMTEAKNTLQKRHRSPSHLQRSAGRERFGLWGIPLPSSMTAPSATTSASALPRPPASWSVCPRATRSRLRPNFWE